MANLYLYLLLSTVLVYFIIILKNPAKVFEYPYFMAVVMAVFILPQAYALIKFPGGVSIDAVMDALLICTLCLLACTIGYRFAPSSSVLNILSYPVSLNRLLVAGIVFALIGLLSGLLLPKDRVEFNNRGGLTGIATIYFFFSMLAFPGFAMCLYVARKKKNWLSILALLFASITPMMSIINGRREPAAMIALSIVLLSFFHNRKPPNRIVLFAAILFATLMIPATSDYRSIRHDYGFTRALAELNLFKNFENFLTRESPMELRNAAAVIQSTQQQKHYKLGAGYWNMMVHRFVPAQFVGRSFKDSLVIGSTLEKNYYEELAINYEMPTGYTITGMGDSYEQFGWFGCLFFAFVAVMYKVVWTTANRPNAVFAQIFYTMICTSAMRAITHQTADFLPGVLYQVIFLGVAYLFCINDRSSTIVNKSIKSPCQNTRTNHKTMLR